MLMFWPLIAIDIACAGAKLWLDTMAAAIRPEKPKRAAVVIWLHNSAYKGGRDAA